MFGTKNQNAAAVGALGGTASPMPLALLDCRGPMPPIIHHISGDEAQPKSADIVVIGGAFVSASAPVSWRGGAYS
ncbi:hypothetical protein [Bradyrhizobium shewense]|nr:hypothetical protein [Bradyrhizobium shewense]